MKNQETVNGSKQAFTVWLEDDLYVELKLAAIQERRPMVAIIRDGLRAYLDTKDTP